MALALNNQQRVDMPLNKETNQTMQNLRLWKNNSEKKIVPLKKKKNPYFLNDPGIFTNTLFKRVVHSKD